MCERCVCVCVCVCVSVRVLISITNSLWTWITLEYLITSNLSGHLALVVKHTWNVHESSRQDSSIRHTHHTHTKINACTVSSGWSWVGEASRFPPLLSHSLLNFDLACPGQTKDYLHFLSDWEGDNEMVFHDKLVISLGKSPTPCTEESQGTRIKGQINPAAGSPVSKISSALLYLFNEITVSGWQGKYGPHIHSCIYIYLTFLIFTVSIIEWMMHQDWVGCETFRLVHQGFFVRLGDLGESMGDEKIILYYTKCTVHLKFLFFSKYVTWK